MRKLVLIPLFAVLALAGCSSDSGDPASSKENIEFVEGLQENCEEGMDNVDDGLANLQETAPLLAYSSDAEVAEYLATARDFVEASLDLVDSCSALDPSGASSLSSSLRSLLDTLGDDEWESNMY